jgi:hypothetical protein
MLVVGVKLWYNAALLVYSATSVTPLRRWYYAALLVYSTTSVTLVQCSFIGVQCSQYSQCNFGKIKQYWCIT